MTGGVPPKHPPWVPKGEGVPHSRVYEPVENGLLSAENRKYLERVLRLKKGDRFFITNGNGCEIEAVLEDNGCYSGVQKTTPAREPPLGIVLFAPILKGERFEFLVEKAVELGVSRIVPMIFGRSVVGFPSDQKIRRWEKIALSAMLQCGGCLKPEIGPVTTVEELPKPDKTQIAVFLHEVPDPRSIGVPVSDFLHQKDKKEVWLISGPEGGLTEIEAELLRKNGWVSVWLGKRLFRADTAPICALSALILPREKKPFVS